MPTAAEIHQDGLALTPPMGWNSWNSFGANISHDAICQTADAMVTLGYKAAGYEYVVIDDIWHGCRGEDGHLQEDRQKFPHGMKALADYVHSKGLKFGIYSDAGVKTCAGKPGSFGHEEQDAQTFAQWGIDFLKYDYCYAPEDYQTAIKLYTRMGKALRDTDRKIVFSVCEWGSRSPWLWAAAAGAHMWRATFDVVNKWDAPHNFRQNSSKCIGVLTAIDRMAGLEKHAGPGGWNDPDMLIVGLKPTDNCGIGKTCNEHEQRTQMSMWCMLAAPLMIGCDIRNALQTTWDILLNSEAIAINQDVLGQQGVCVSRIGPMEVWKKSLTGDRFAVAILNRDEHEQPITALWSDLELPEGQTMKVRDLWAHKDLGSFTGSIAFSVWPHECKLLLLQQ
jgi:alpha-galactosidase